MPTYEYECRKCKRVFEHFQSMASEPLKTCVFDGCNGKVNRLVSAGAGLIFKGNGFYETDYKRKSNGSNGTDSKSTAPVCPASKDNSCPNSKSCPVAAKGE